MAQLIKISSYIPLKRAFQFLNIQTIKLEPILLVNMDSIIKHNNFIPFQGRPIEFMEK